jgi:ABC-type glycerol-3-phosphate transport system substrate-binding protein
MQTICRESRGEVIIQSSLIALAFGMILIAAPAHAEKLTVWLVGDDKAPKVLKPAVDAFKDRNPGVEFEVRAIPWGDAMTKYSAAIASKTGPDILTGGLSYGIELGAKGGLVDLAQKAPDLVAFLDKKANKGIMRSIRNSNGAMYALPYDISVQLQLYRTDMVAKPPATWNEFTAAVAEQRAAGNKGWAQQWGNMGWIGFFPYLLQAGGSFYDAQCTKATLASPEAVKALRYYASFYTDLKAPSDTWPDVETGLESGTYPLAQTGSWVFTSLDASRKKIVGKWSVAKLPAGPTGKSTAFLGGTVIGVTSLSTHPDLAISFLRTLYDSAIAKQMINASFSQKLLWLPGGREDLIGSANLPVDRKRALLAQLEDAEGPPNCKGWEAVDPAVTRAIQQVVLGGADPEEALAAAAEKMNRALAK